MDYEVFLMSRIREAGWRTGDNCEAVATGLQRTGRIITTAALLLVVVIGAFSLSGIVFVKLIGVGHGDRHRRRRDRSPRPCWCRRPCGCWAVELVGPGPAGPLPGAVRAP